MRGLTIFLLTISTLSVRAETKHWIAVTTPGLRKALRPLEKQRQAEGWTVTVLNSESDINSTRRKIAGAAGGEGTVCLVLAGDFGPKAEEGIVPSGQGIQLRMKGKLSDSPWNILENQPDRKVETGRLPAGDSEEMEVMVRKILAWPEQSRKMGLFPRAAVIGGYHAAPALFEKIADSMFNGLAQRLASRFPAAWRFNGIVDINDSPWQGSGTEIMEVSRSLIKTSTTFLAFMGHSSWVTPESKGRQFLGVDDWRSLPPGPPATGLFFSCGCYTCELKPELESYGFAAIRSVGGPAAVIGSHGETAEAFGYLALAGLIDSLSANPAPVRLGELWNGVRDGLGKGEISSSEFAMMDMSDGTQGRVPLADQRLEHLESWMLLGDPAMPLLPPLPAIKLQVSGKPEAGKKLIVSGEVPAALTGAELQITFERHPGTIRQDLPEVPATGDRVTAAKARRALSNDVVLTKAATTAQGTKFTLELPLPDKLPPPPWTLRAAPVKGPSAAGVLQIP